MVSQCSFIKAARPGSESTSIWRTNFRLTAAVCKGVYQILLVSTHITFVRQYPPSSISPRRVKKNCPTILFLPTD